MSFSLLQLRTLARQRADQENSSFVSDSEVTNYINLGYGELYDLLVSQFADYFSSTETFTLSGTNTHALPADFYKIRGLDYNVSGSDYVTVFPFNFNERNKFDYPVSRMAYGSFERQYRVMGSNLILEPAQNVDGTYRMWYVPRFTRLSADGDLMSNVLDFEEYVIVDAAIMMMVKEESDPSSLMMVKEALKNRIVELSKDRDAGMPERVGDVTGYLDFFGSLSSRP